MNNKFNVITRNPTNVKKTMKLYIRGKIYVEKGIIYKEIFSKCLCVDNVVLDVTVPRLILNFKDGCLNMIYRHILTRS